MHVKGKVAIITGASSGIGYATAELLVKQGAKVALVARSKEKLETLSKKLLSSFFVVCDMSKEDEVKEMIKKVYKHFGRIDILVNNAGQGYDASVEKIDIQKFRSIIDLNLLGPLVAMQQVIPIMRKQKNGIIINVSSGTALMNIPNISAYSSIKKALSGLSLTAREELKKDGIVVSIVYPFITATNFHKNILGGGREELPGRDDPNLPKADSAEYVAKKILEAIESEKAEIFAHDWMEKST